MISIMNEKPNIDYSWLLDKPLIREDYVKLYIENYIFLMFNLISDNEWYRNSKNQLTLIYDLDDSSEFQGVYSKVKESPDYVLERDNNSTDVYTNRVYVSTTSDIEHSVTVVGDLEDYKYEVSVSIEDSDIDRLISDQYLINLYNDENGILMDLLSSKKGE